MNMGFEGIDWKLDENGNYVSLLDPSIQGSATSVLGGKYPSKESSFGGLILPDDFSLVSPNYSHEIQDTVRGFYKLREELSDTTTLLPREYEYEFLSSRENRRQQWIWAMSMQNLSSRTGSLKTTGTPGLKKRWPLCSQFWTNLTNK